MSADVTTGEQLEAIGQAAEALWDATRRFQDLLDEIEGEQLGRWAAYSRFRDIGSVFRFALERLRMEKPLPELEEIIDVYQAGARAGFESAADLADAMRDGGDESVEIGVERLTLASQQFVRGRHLLETYLGRAAADGSGQSNSNG